MKGPTRVKFTVLAGVPFLMVLGNSMLFPIFPKMQTALHLSKFQTSLVVTAFSIPAGLLIPLAGYLADHYGRKVVMAPSILLFGIGGLIAATSATLWGGFLAYGAILTGRIVQGIGAAGMSQLAMVLVADIFQSRERSKALGLLEAANGLGKVVSPILGGLVGMLLWFLPFYIFGSLAIPLAIAIWLLIHEPAKNRSRDGLRVYLRRILGFFQVKGMALATALWAGLVALFILFGTLFYLSEVLEKTYHMPELLVGFILALPVGAMSLTSFLSGLYLQKRVGMTKMAVVLGLSIVTVVMVVAALFLHRWILFAAISFMGVGGGMVLPALNLLITSSVPLKERAMITSFYGGVRFFGVALGPPTFGLLMKYGNGVLFGSAAVITGVSAFLALFFLNQKLLLGKGGGVPQELPVRPLAFTPFRLRKGPQRIH